MIDEIDRLVERVKYDVPGFTPATAVLKTLELLRAEVQKRVAFERAMIRYLEESPSAPFAASAEFLAWLRFDADAEGQGRSLQA